MTKRFTVNLAALAVLWVLITEARADSWIIGAPVVAMAAAAATALASPQGWRWTAGGFLAFLPHFLRCSFLGGLDVAWRSMHPRLPIDPQLIQYKLRLPNSAPRIFFMNVVNLLPGTVSADVRDDVLKVHVIDGRQPIRQQLENLERVVGNLFAVPLATKTEEGERLS